MSQSDFGTLDPNVVSGTQLAIYLNEWRDAVHSLHRGTERPGYVRPGMLWVREVSSSRWDLMLFNGATDSRLRCIDPSIGDTGASQVPAGTTAQRPDGSNGMLRYNSESGQFEGYQNGAWAPLGGSASETLADVVATFPLGVPQHIATDVDLPDCALLDGSDMPEWASAGVKLMYGATLPDYRGRTPVGTNEGSGRVGAGWAQTPGQGGGEEKHTLTTAEMPRHSHGGSTNTTGNHNHPIPLKGNSTNWGVYIKGAADVASSETTQYTSAAGNHAHTVYIDNTGGGNAHNIMQPGISGRWLMRLR